VRALAALLVLVLTSCTNNPQVTLPTPVPTREPGIANVAVLLDLSGARAPSGQPQRDAMQIWLDQPPVSPVKLRVKFVDVAGSDAKLLLEFRRAVVDDRADAVVVGVPVPSGGPFMQAVQVASVPVLLTLPVAEPMSGLGGRFAFALAPTPEQLAQLLAQDLIDRGVLAPTLLAGDETPAAAAERSSFLAELRARAIAPPTPVSLASPDAAQRVRAAATVAKSIVLFGASAPYGDVIRSIPVGVTAPHVYLSYLTETADVTNLRDQAALATWPGAIALATPATTSVQAGFFRTFRDRHGAPSTLAASAFDALGLIEVAARQAPTELDAGNLRLRLETSTFRGVVTRYAFDPQRHAGFATRDLAYLSWSSDREAPELR
jgi:ABC-type branched-subunit amino acid transport system substrate-binding protein